MASIHGRPSNRSTWKPGQSGNPRGRPSAGLELSPIIAELLEYTERRATVRSIRDAPENVKRKYRLAERIINDALAGQASAQRLILQYLDGVPAQRIEVNHEPPVPKDFSRLTDDELRQAIALAEKIHG